MRPSPARAPLLSPALPPAAPGACFDLRAPGFRAFLQARYGDIAAPCEGSHLTMQAFLELYQCTPAGELGEAASLIAYTREKWSKAWREYVARSGL